MPLLRTEYLHKDAGAPPPANPNTEVFSADAQVLPSTANAKDGTIDVVWYSGAAVPRIDRATGEPYMLQLDMQGCRFDRLNNGAPVFDTHFTGDDFKSLIAGKVGTRAQVGVVRRAWPNGDKGMATLQFDLGDPDGAEMFRKASTGILQNLSFGTFVYKREKLQTEGMPEGKPPYLNDKEIGMFQATDWEPFEISPCTVPADFNTCFLSAQPTGEVTIFGTPDSGVIDALRAISPQKEKPAMEPTTQDTGADARAVNEQALAAAREEAVQAERQRVSEIQSLGVTAIRYGVDDTVISEFIAKGVPVDQARKEVFAQLEKKGKKDANGNDFDPPGTVWGIALPEIWCNSGGNPLFAFLASALMVDYRDESGYADSLGILGAGPLGGFTPSMVVTNADGYRYVVAPMVDGYLWQGLKLDGNLNVTKYQPGMGLRYIPGSDPANPAADYFSLGQGTPQVWEPNVYAAGTAACEIRIVKSTTIQPSTPDQHQMKVPIDYGMWGWTWDQNGNRTSVRGLINPFWIAVNMLLRAMGLYGDPSTGSTPAGGSGPASADQLAAFVLPSLMAGDGSGSAEIAAAQVPAILGAGNETQFQFQGVISSQKPFRDWLTEVLNCCLGFYAWEFGKLKLGCRINASAVDAYTPANMLFQSLKLTPIQAAFEHLVISFADVAYQYQANTAEYCDKSHAAYYGRAGSPLTSQMHSVGCSTLSQALRIAATRTREEIGGVNPNEWRNARCASWGTTLLGLGNEVGQVASITHPDVPSGTGKFRIQRWSLKKDWSVQIEAQTVTDSMYDLDVGPKPMDVVPAPLPGLYYPIPLGPAWAPYQVQAASWDALFPNEWTFDSNQTYTTLADGSALASLIVTGKLPVNEFSATGAGAPGIGSISQSATGGSLPANATLRVTVCAIDSSGLPSAPSNIAIIGTGTAAGGSLTLENITWPAVAGLVSYVLFVATQDDLICVQATGTLTPGPNNTYTPGSITFSGPVARSTWALPSPYVSRIRVKAKRVVHGGVIGAPVTSVIAPNQIVSSWLIDTAHLTSFNPVGRILSIIGRPESSTPLLSVTITAYDSATGTLTLVPQAVVSGHPELSIQPDDVFVIRYKADAPNTATPTQITDSGCQNMEYPGGMTAGAEVGNILRVIQGTGRGELRKITGNTATQLCWDLPLVLDETSVWIVEAPAWDYSADSTAIDNADPSRAVTLNIATDNFIDQALVIAGFTVDVNGNESPDGDVPIREDWIFGAEGEKVAGFTLPVSGVLGIQADAAPAFYLNSDFTAGSMKAYVKSAPVGADLVFTIYAGADAWITLTIPNGSTSVVATAAQIDASETIPANTNIRLAVTAVGTTYPGSDLSVFVYS